MPTFNKSFSFQESPFEQYVAENEPDIGQYAVVPPYFETSKRRALRPSSHILFGSRGSGKSATRLTTEKELWSLHSEGEKVPLPVPFVDFSPLIDRGSLDQVTTDALVKQLAFLTLEVLFLWISNQEEEEELIEMLNTDEKNLFFDLSLLFYLNVPEQNRQVSQNEVMRLLQQNWANRTQHWMQQRWVRIATVIGKVTSAILSKKYKIEDVSKEISFLLSDNGEIRSPTAMLSKLVELVEVFGFSGISVFVDKVDEHPKTQSSPAQTAKLVYPLLSQVQLMEVHGLGWQFFLWDRVSETFNESDLYVRLDKIAHSEVSWTDDYLKLMIDERLKHFSNKKVASFSDLVEEGVNADPHIQNAIELSGRSPRELVRILDTITREYDARYAVLDTPKKLDDESFSIGMDKYVQDVIWRLYERDILSQILRLEKSTFINKDVQQAFKLSPPGATNRIKKWEACGAVKLTGTRSAEGQGGGKPANEYAISDPRIMRLASRKLYDPNDLTEAAAAAPEFLAKPPSSDDTDNN